VPEIDFAGKRVLLAEDNEINAEIAKNLLEIKKCAVDIADNGAVAIETFTTTPVGYYDAILMDIRMPIMDGLEATKVIRAMKKADSATVPIIAMTANAFQEDVKMSLDSGMNAHLAKPIDPVMLYDTLAKYFGKTQIN
jgi:CheY-like chemotaxis protein